MTSERYVNWNFLLKVLTCDIGGQWSGKSPQCRFIDCGAPAQIEFGSVALNNATTTVGSIITYTCRPDYWLVGEAKLECTREGKWNHETPSCERNTWLPLCSITANVFHRRLSHFRTNIKKSKQWFYKLCIFLYFCIKIKVRNKRSKSFFLCSNYLRGARSSRWELRGGLRSEHPQLYRIPLRRRISSARRSQTHLR